MKALLSARSVRQEDRLLRMVMAYAVVNDNTTNDGYVVMGNMMNGGRGMGGGMMMATR
jgi:hypothetical protein